VNRRYFFDRVRNALFAGSLTKDQVDGMTRILDYRDAKWPKMSDAELAYLLATVKHETAHTMQPITELGTDTYLRGKPYWPWIGRGLIQLTWKANYDRFNVDNPEDACEWPVALDIAFRGMIFGMFTGRKLSHYITPTHNDFVGARRIINGTDRANLIAGYARSFLDALTQSRQAA
jgi:putative chitinase